jgi:uncharacterized damage-inducible protein DinB
MESHGKEQWIIGIHPSKEPEVGRWLWALQNTRQRTLREIRDVSGTILDWIPTEAESSLGTVLYHLAGIEADYLYVEVLEQAALPPEVAAYFPHATRDEQGRLTQVRGDSLEQHLRRLEIVRGLLLEVYQQMELAEFRRVRSLEYYDVTPEYVLHHLMQHEAEHRSQIGAIRARAERALAIR